MLWMKLLVVDTFYPRSNNFVMGVKIKATGKSKLNDSPGYLLVRWVPLNALGTFLNRHYFKTNTLVRATAH